MLGRTDRSLLGIWWWTVDRYLLTAILLLLVTGILMVMAASPAVAQRISLPDMHFVWRQLVYLVPAIGAMLFFSLLTPRLIRILSLISLTGVVGLMIATLVLGPEVKGATRWITIGPLNLQPSEFAKPFFAIVSGWLLSLWREGDDFPGWIWAGGLAGIIVSILILQPDVGMTAVVALTWGFQMFLAGMPWLLVVGAVIVTAGSFGLAYLNLSHVKNRVDKFLDGGSMQSDLSIRSFADGGILGVGPGDGQIKHYLPDAHADFIFSVAAEEYGVLVCLLIIALYGFIVMRSFSKAAARDNLFCLIAGAGLAMQFGVQAAIHMASSVDLIPTKGMTLPLISYGGSSLLASGITIGMILALTRRRLREGGLNG